MSGRLGTVRRPRGGVPNVQLRLGAFRLGNLKTDVTNEVVVNPAWDSQDYGCTDYALEWYRPDCAGGRFHCGVDLACGYRADVRTTRAGTVVAIAADPYLGDSAVWIRAEEGVYLGFGHLDQATVSVGMRVGQGQVIGYAGTKGHSNGVHVHFTARTDGAGENSAYNTVDPQPFLTYGGAPADPGAFSGVADADGGSWTHSKADSSEATRKRLVAKGTVLVFDRYCHSEVVNDAVTGAPDDRWFHLSDGSDEWAASAVVNGNPSASTPVVAAPGHPAIFSGVVSADGGAFTHKYAVTAVATRGRLIAKDTALVFDRYCHSEVVNDAVTGSPDDRWFHLNDGSDEWIASAMVNGNPGADVAVVAAPLPPAPAPVPPVVPPPPVPFPPTPTPMPVKVALPSGLGVWEWNDEADYSALRVAGADYVLIRAANGDGGQVDTTDAVAWHLRAPKAALAGLLPVAWTYWYGAVEGVTGDVAAYLLGCARHTAGLKIDTPYWVVDAEARDLPGLAAAVKELRDLSGKSVLVAPPGDPSEYGLKWDWKALDAAADGYVPQVYTSPGAWNGVPNPKDPNHSAFDGYVAATAEWSQPPPLFPACDETDAARVADWCRAAVAAGAPSVSYWRSGVGTVDTVRAYAAAFKPPPMPKPVPTPTPTPAPKPVPVPTPPPIPTPTPVPQPKPVPGPSTNLLTSLYAWILELVKRVWPGKR